MKEQRKNVGGGNKKPKKHFIVLFFIETPKHSRLQMFVINKKTFTWNLQILLSCALCVFFFLFYKKNICEIYQS
jgi:hypothetical protein